MTALNHILRNEDFRQSAVFGTLSAQPMGFVDIGARGGMHEMVEPLAGVTAVMAFEPDPEECDRLRGELEASSPWRQVRIEPTALAGSAGEAQLHLITMPTNNSLRAPNPDFLQRYKMDKWQIVGTSSLTTTTLDHEIFEVHPEEPYWGEAVKLDTQGTEQDILEGAERTLRERTLCVLSEVSFAELYSGQKLFSDMELFLRQQGFAFYGFGRTYHRSTKLLNKGNEAGLERMVQADALFFKDPLTARQQIPTRSAHVLFACALVSKYYDFALELALGTWADGAEAGRIGRLVHSLAAHDPRDAETAIAHLAEGVRTRPDLATALLGRFIDERRLLGDYHDVVLPADFERLLEEQ